MKNIKSYKILNSNIETQSPHNCKTLKSFKVELNTDRIVCLHFLCDRGFNNPSVESHVLINFNFSQLFLRFSRCLVREHLTEILLETKRLEISTLQKLFISCNELKQEFVEMNSWMHRSDPYCRTRTAQGTNRNSPFHRRPVKPYNELHYSLFKTGLLQAVFTIFLKL